MPTTAKRAVITLWHYQCPECGFSDAEFGHHLDAHTIFCEVCIEEQIRVRLKKWPVDDSGTPPGVGS